MATVTPNSAYFQVIIVSSVLFLKSKIIHDNRIIICSMRGGFILSYYVLHYEYDMIYTCSKPRRIVA